MQLIEVQSSHVARIGYDPASRLLRVVYRDGTVYDHDDISPELHLALMAAESKGRFLQRHIRGGRRLATPDGTPILHRAIVEVTKQSRVQTFEPDSCCGPSLQRAMLQGKLDEAMVWPCPKCGCEWTAVMVGEVKHWSPVPMIALLRV